MKRLSTYLMFVLFFGTLWSVLLLSVILPDTDISTVEQRTLQQKPVNDMGMSSTLS